MPKSRFEKIACACLLILGVIVIGLVVALVQTNHKLSKLQDDNRGNYAMAVNKAAYGLAEEKAVIDPITPQVYLPELRIKLPFDSVSKTIAYQMRNVYPGTKMGPGLEADVISTKYVPPPELTRVDCSNFVRLKLEAEPNPYSPHEKPTSVKLADGRTLQVYELVNEPECNSSWYYSGISPSMMAQEFTKAQTY
jgi:hypothetical protein